MTDKKISIVTAYYNRKKLLYNTLKTIELSKQKDLVEIIVVDDNSNDNNRIDDFPSLFNLDLKIIRINKEDKWWVNPSIPFNIGFKEAKNDIIIIQNPECIHFGDIIETTLNNIQDNIYLNFATYSIDSSITDKINKIDFNGHNIINNIGKMIYPLINRGIYMDGTTAWYNHSIYRPHKLHFCSAIMKKDLDDLGGFDERYAKGIAYDDNDFLLRVQRKAMKIEMIDKPFVIHQFHKATQYAQQQELVRKNFLIYQTAVQKENGYKVNIK